jgi:hypothetical protein
VTPTEARTIVAAGLASGLIRPPDPAAVKIQAQASRIAALTRYWEHAAMIRGRKRWRDMAPEEQRAVRALYMRQLRGKRRDQGWTPMEIERGRRDENKTQMYNLTRCKVDCPDCALERMKGWGK